MTKHFTVALRQNWRRVSSTVSEDLSTSWIVCHRQVGEKIGLAVKLEVEKFPSMLINSVDDLGDDPFILDMFIHLNKRYYW